MARLAKTENSLRSNYNDVFYHGGQSHYKTRRRRGLLKRFVRMVLFISLSLTIGYLTYRLAR